MISVSARLGRICAALVVATGALAQQPIVPETVEIPGGEFVMGSAKGAEWEQPPHPVLVPTFRIGVKPVSNIEYLQFRSDHESARESPPDEPVTGVSFYDAQDYCAWLSERTGRTYVLPTEAWWERAVRGGLEQRDYPWGDERRAGGRASSQAEGRANAFGVHAVYFNLWEWTADWYAPDYYEHGDRRNPAGPESGVYRTLRGGGFRNDVDSARTYTRGSARPTTRSDNITFRVAIAPPGSSSQLTSNRPRPAPSRPVRSRPRVVPQPAPQPREPAGRATARGPSTQPATAPRSRRRQPANQPPATPAVASNSSVSRITFESADHGGAVRIVTDEDVEYGTMSLSGPDRLVIDLRNSRLGFSPPVGKIAADTETVHAVRYSQFSNEPPVVRVVVDLAAPVDSEVERSADGLLVRLSGER